MSRTGFRVFRLAVATDMAPWLKDDDVMLSRSVIGLGPKFDTFDEALAFKPEGHKEGDEYIIMGIYQ